MRVRLTDLRYLWETTLLAERSNEPVKCACILVNSDGEVIARAFNTQRKDGLVVSHAEMKAIRQANEKLGRRLNGITAYGNCEPYTMCLSAFIFAKVSRVVFCNRLNDFVPDNQKNRCRLLWICKKVSL